MAQRIVPKESRIALREKRLRDRLFKEYPTMDLDRLRRDKSLYRQLLLLAKSIGYGSFGKMLEAWGYVTANENAEPASALAPKSEGTPAKESAPIKSPKKPPAAIPAQDTAPKSGPALGQTHLAMNGMSYVGARSDYMWRQTSYDLASLPHDTARAVYRTRLEFVPTHDEVNAFDQLLDLLRIWVLQEEDRRNDSAKSELVDAAQSFERFSFGGVCAYGTDTFLRTDTLWTGEDGAGERYWAMQYTSRDVVHGYRFWITDVGLTGKQTGVCTLNMRTRYLDAHTYIYEGEEVRRQAPILLRRLMRVEDCDVLSGKTVLSTHPLFITKYSLDEFVTELTRADRTIPLVVIAAKKGSGRSGDYYVSPWLLARRLCGIANVYTLDRNNPSTDKAYRRIFGNPDLPAYKYRLEPGTLRVFWEDVNLDHPQKYDYARHRFFTAEALEASDVDQIIKNISGGITRTVSLFPGEVLDIKSVELQRSKAEAKRLESAREELAKRIEESERRRVKLEEDLRNAGEWREQDEALVRGMQELKDYVALLEDENANLSERLDEYSDGFTAAEIEGLFERNEELEQKHKESEGKLQVFEGKLGQAEHYNSQLEEQLRQARMDLDSRRTMEEVLFDAGEYIRSVEAAALMARRALKSRVVIMDEAVASARDCSGDACAVYRALVTLYTVLWEMRFGADGSANISEDEFKALSGFEVSFREKKLTNRSARLNELRKRVYEGREIDITPHVKVSNKRGSYLRIHFAFLDDLQLIVVGHCGDHLKTSGTSRM